MKESTLALFAQASREIFSEIGFQDLLLSGDGGENSRFEVMASIGIAGDICGFLSISCTMDSALSFIDRILKNMDMDAEEDGFGQFHREALGEIVNQVSGRTTVLLSEHGYDCDITPPTILVGDSIDFDMREISDSYTRNIRGDFGSINLFVGVKCEREPTRA
jgi:chemotaxis protein CheX